jgi:hypothetical protein
MFTTHYPGLFPAKNVVQTSFNNGVTQDSVQVIDKESELLGSVGSHVESDIISRQIVSNTDVFGMPEVRTCKSDVGRYLKKKDEA